MCWVQQKWAGISNLRDFDKGPNCYGKATGLFLVSSVEQWSEKQTKNQSKVLRAHQWQRRLSRLARANRRSTVAQVLLMFMGGMCHNTQRITLCCTVKGPNWTLEQWKKVAWSDE